MFVRLLVLFAALVPCAAADLAADALSDLARDYRFRLLSGGAEAWGRRDPGITAAPAPAGAVAAYAPLLASEWRLYPASLVSRTRLTRLVLCSGLAWRGQPRQAVPEFPTATLWLDVVSGNTSYLRHVVHHEFFHMIDLADDGQLYQDPAWLRLNPPGFRYGPGGAAMRDPTVALCNHPRPGFLNRYQTAGVEEDKAEIFAYLMLQHSQALGFARQDPTIAKKVSQLQGLMERFCPEMNARFWAELPERRRALADPGR